MTYTNEEIQLIMEYNGWAFKGNVWWKDGYWLGEVSIPDRLSDSNFLDALEDKMITETWEQAILDGVSKKSEIRISIHIADNLETAIMYELYDYGSKIYISGGSATTKNEARLNAILNFLKQNNK
jgi:hypothetical protein